jgi:hypothetical protein
MRDIKVPTTSTQEVPMTTMSTTSDTLTPDKHALAERARREGAAGLETVRAAAAEAGQRVPEIVSAVRDGTAESVRTVGTWPEATQRLFAVFSVGLGLGLMIAGAPRLLVGGALAPAIAVAAIAMGRETRGARRPA